MPVIENYADNGCRRAKNAYDRANDVTPYRGSLLHHDLVAGSNEHARAGLVGVTKIHNQLAILTDEYDAISSSALSGATGNRDRLGNGGLGPKVVQIRRTHFAAHRHTKQRFDDELRIGLERHQKLADSSVDQLYGNPCYANLAKKRVRECAVPRDHEEIPTLPERALVHLPIRDEKILALRIVGEARGGRARARPRRRRALPDLLDSPFGRSCRLGRREP